jgi:hypothetical protein
MCSQAYATAAGANTLSVAPTRSAVSWVISLASLGARCSRVGAPIAACRHDQLRREADQLWINAKKWMFAADRESRSGR